LEWLKDTFLKQNTFKLLKIFNEKLNQILEYLKILNKKELAKNYLNSIHKKNKPLHINFL